MTWVKKITKITAEFVANKIEGKLFGDKNIYADNITSLNEATKNSICFCDSDSEKVLNEAIKNFKGSILITKNAPQEIPSNTTIIKTSHPKKAILSLIPDFYEKEDEKKVISEKAEISSQATLGENIAIGAFSVISDDVVIGDNVTIHPHVVLYKGAKIGKNTILHSGVTIREYCEISENSVIQNGAIIGADGFGYVPNKLGELVSVPQVGNTYLGPNVDVGANACIDRGALGSTSISKGTKIDNLVQIGHNVKIASNTVICGQTGIGGSSTIGKNVVLGGQTGVADHIFVADLVRTAGKTTVIQNIKEKGDYIGYPAEKAKKWMRTNKRLKELDKLYKKVEKLK